MKKNFLIGGIILILIIVIGIGVILTKGYKKCDVVEGAYCFKYAKKCIGEGKNLVDPHLTGVIAKCCEGLKEIGPYEIVPQDLNECGMYAIQGNYGICSNCGDGVCKSWENACNCPEDCKK